LYVALAGYDDAFHGQPGHVFKTVSALSPSPAWVNVSPGIDLPHNVIALDPAEPTSVYVGTDAAVWHTSDGGQSWQFLGPITGQPNVPVFDLKIHASSHRIIAFTFGRGAYSLDPSVTPTSGPVATVNGNGPIQAVLGVPFSQKLEAAGTPPYAWAAMGGGLPPGLTLDADGTIAGLSLNPGVYTFTAQVTNALGYIASRTFTLSIGSSGDKPVWFSMGPSPLSQTGGNHDVPAAFRSGRVAAVAIDPADPNH
jgi:hypothetical protein